MISDMFGDMFTGAAEHKHTKHGSSKQEEMMRGIEQKHVVGHGANKVAMFGSIATIVVIGWYIGDVTKSGLIFALALIPLFFALGFWGVWVDWWQKDTLSSMPPLQKLLVWLLAIPGIVVGLYWLVFVGFYILIGIAGIALMIFVISGRGEHKRRMDDAVMGDTIQNIRHKIDSIERKL